MWEVSEHATRKETTVRLDGIRQLIPRTRWWHRGVDDAALGLEAAK